MQGSCWMCWKLVHMGTCPRANLLLYSRLVTCTRPLSSLSKAVAPPPPPSLDCSPPLHPHIPGPCSPSQVAVLTVTNVHSALSHVRSPQRPSEGKHSYAHLTKKQTEAQKGSLPKSTRRRRAKARVGLGVCRPQTLRLSLWSTHWELSPDTSRSKEQEEKKDTE